MPSSFVNDYSMRRGQPVSDAPALFQHCCEVWETMDKASKDLVLPETGDKVRVYEGFTTKLFDQLHLPVPYYTSVFTALKGMDCVRQIRRGGGGSPSQWLIVQRPTIELFDHAKSKSTVVKAGRDAQLAQMINDLNTRVNKLEQAVTILLEERRDQKSA
jgi:hypothetical protein